ncbi:MAG TPA: protein translocase subunit SecD [Acidimicrobiales bacterium]
MASRKRRRSNSLIFIVIAAVVCLCYTVLTNDRPFLGLDLQGGVSVVLQPQDPNVSKDSLEQAKQIINRRINGLGVAEANVTLQGNTILVEIPGVKDRDRALRVIGQTAQLEFRPVLAKYPVTPAATTDTTGSDGGTSIPPVDPSQSTSTSQQGLAPSGGAGLVEGESAAGLQNTGPVATPTTAAAPAAATATTVAPGAPTSTLDPAAQAALQAQLQAQVAGQTGQAPPVTSDEDLAKPDAKSQIVVLPEVDRKTGETVAIYKLGPTLVQGTALSGATATIGDTGIWQVNPTFKDGKDGIDAFNAAAAKCFAMDATICPKIGSASHGALAVVLDNEVLTAPSIDAASFTKDQIRISGSFDEKSAKDVALALKYGALPVVLVAQQSQIVSATLGQDALHAGLVAGAVGFVLVGIYMIAFYRFLGVLAMLKLLIEASILWALLCYMGAHIGLALTLAGITGIIVSIGVSLDSNVVYYEHLKEDIRAGRTVRSAVDQSFASAWSTILAADGASVIGAALLYFLTIGAVRGFALFLGLSTLLDLLTSYCYMRPVVRWATSSQRCLDHPHQFGLPATPVAQPSTTAKVSV